MILHLAGLVVALASAGGGDADSELRQAIVALKPKDLSAEENAVLDNLEARARSALAAIRHAGDRRTADEQRPALRARLERSLGLSHLPWPPALKSRVIGTLARPGYRLEKIVYETLPGLLVPVHLYVPDGPKQPAPAVLFYPGHWWADSKSRPDFQAFCINMARLGFVVLSFDPFGQGERGVSARDHRRTEALLVGVAQQGIAAYETRCALEYLMSRREVDPGRIGMTGASGGGYNTWITTALDDRIAAAVPVVGTSEFAEQIDVCRPLDWYHAAEHCHFLPGLIRYANNHEFLAMAAPRPVLIVAAAHDQSFPIAGVKAVYQYGRALYDSYRQGERIRFFEDRTEGHGYQQRKREAAYGWFLRWLMKRGDGSAFSEPATETLPFDSVELRCFSPGQNQPAGPGLIALVNRLADNLPPPVPMIELESVLGPWPTPAGPPVMRRTGTPLSVGRTRLRRLLIPTDRGITIPAFLLQPDAGTGVKGVLVGLDDGGKEGLAADPVLAEALEQGWEVCGMDPRGIGELATAKTGWVFAVSLLLGENFIGRQAWDLRRVLEELNTAAALRDEPVVIYARGPNASLAATYALVPDGPDRAWQSRLKGYILRDSFLSFRAFFERPRSMRQSYRLLPVDRDRTTAYDREIPATFFAFDVLRHWDLAQLWSSTSAMGLLVDPINGDWERLPEPAARKILPASTHVVSEGSRAGAIASFLRGMAH
jgi:dienelactone hydrolase